MLALAATAEDSLRAYPPLVASLRLEVSDLESELQVADSAKANLRGLWQNAETRFAQADSAREEEHRRRLALDNLVANLRRDLKAAGPSWSLDLPGPVKLLAYGLAGYGVLRLAKDLVP